MFTIWFAPRSCHSTETLNFFVLGSNVPPELTISSELPRYTFSAIIFLENKLSVRPGSDVLIDQTELTVLKDRKYVVPGARTERFPDQLWSRKNRMASSPSSAMKLALILFKDSDSKRLATIETKDSEKIVALMIETAITISKRPNPALKNGIEFLCRLGYLIEHKTFTKNCHPRVNFVKTRDIMAFSSVGANPRIYSY